MVSLRFSILLCGSSSTLAFSPRKLGKPASIALGASRMQISTPSKQITFIRHGRTHCNEFMEKPGNEWGPGFVDPGMFDTRLSEHGVRQARELGESWGRSNHDVQLLCISPLTRALETATHVFGSKIGSPTMRTSITHLCAERVYLSSEKGRPADELAEEFKAFDFNSLKAHSNGAWWYTPSSLEDYEEWRPEGQYCCPGEPKAVFEERLMRFKDWLKSQPEERIAVVAHWGVIYALTGKSLQNCEVAVVDLGVLLELPLTEAN